MRRCVVLCACVLALCAPQSESFKIIKKITNFFSPSTTTTPTPGVPVVPSYEKEEDNAVIPLGEEATEELHGSTTPKSDWASISSTEGNYDRDVSPAHKESKGHYDTIFTTKPPTTTTELGVYGLNISDQNVIEPVLTTKRVPADNISTADSLFTTEQNPVHPNDQVSAQKKPSVSNNYDGSSTTEQHPMYTYPWGSTTEINHGKPISGISTTVRSFPNQKSNSSDAGQIVFVDSSELDGRTSGNSQRTEFNYSSTTPTAAAGVPDDGGRGVISAPAKPCEAGKRLDDKGNCKTIARK